MPSVAEVGIAVFVLLVVLVLVWRQLCGLQDKVITTIEKQAVATAQQASSNGEVAKAISGLQGYMERNAEGELSYRVGMRNFADSMAKTAAEVLQEMREHRGATEVSPSQVMHNRRKGDM